MENFVSDRSLLEQWTFSTVLRMVHEGMNSSPDDTAARTVAASSVLNAVV